MPAEEKEGDISRAPSLKKRKTSSSPLLATPLRVLDHIKRGDIPDKGRILQALCNAVISSSVDDDEDPESLKLLAELLAEDGVDPNAGDDALWDNYGGSPLYQACALDLPETTALLLNHGASVVQTYKDQTPLHVALANKDSRCVRVIMKHIGQLEEQAREGRGKGPSHKGASHKGPSGRHCQH